MASIQSETSEQLDRDELLERIRISSPDLVEELYKTSKEYLASEITRENNLNAKAISLLTASGLSLTVAFTFGGILLQHPEYHGSLWGLWPYIVPILYGSALLVGLSASAFAVWALLVRGDYVGVSEQDVFKREVLAEAEKLDFASLPESSRSDNHGQTEHEDNHSITADPTGDALPKSPPTESLMSVDQAAPTGAGVMSPGEPAPPYPKSGTAYYRRFMTVHIWLIARAHFEIHEVKAKRIKLGQKLFFVFLLFLAAIGVSLTAVALVQQRKLATSSLSETIPTDTTQQASANQQVTNQHPPSTTSASAKVPPSTVLTPSASDGGTTSDVDGGGTTRITNDAGSTPAIQNQ